MLEDLGGKATQTIKSAKLAKYWAHAANEEMTARLNSIHVPMTKHNLGGSRRSPQFLMSFLIFRVSLPNPASILKIQNMSLKVRKEKNTPAWFHRNLGIAGDICMCGLVDMCLSASRQQAPLMRNRVSTSGICA